jgi:hypothetical protein
LGSIAGMLISEKTKIVLSFANILVLGVVVWTGAVKITEMQNDIKNNTELIIYSQKDIKETKEIVKEHSVKIQKIEISDAENKIRIINIEARVVEILSILKNK